MKPTKFAEENRGFKGAEGSGIIPLPVYQDTEEIVSCWQVSWRERLSVIIFGRVWLSVLGEAQPPVLLLASDTFFIRKPKLIACRHCFGNGYKPHSQSYKGNNVNIKVTCAYCKGDGLNWLGRLVERLKAWKEAHHVAKG